MGIFRNFMGMFSSAGHRQEGLQSGRSPIGDMDTNVTLDNALKLSAVWAAVRLISESIGSLPLNIYSVDADGAETLDKKHRLSILFSDKPNRWQTRQEYFETLTYQLMMMGNAYSAVQRNDRGEIVALIPLMSEQMEVSLQSDGSVQYRYTDGNNVSVYASKSIWHVKLFGNAIIGLSPLSYAGRTLGIAQGAEQTTSKVYKNGGKPSGVLSIDKVLTKEQRDAVKANFSELAEGNSDRLFVLEAGMKYTQVSLSPQDIELLSSRRFQIEDIGRFFNVPSVLLNDMNASTAWGSGLQQIIQGFYKFSLRPIALKYQNSIKSNLMDAKERHKYAVKFDFEDLIRPDRQERLKANKEGIMSGQVTPNEARLAEGNAAMDGGDRLYMQQQMTPIDQLPIIKGTTNEND